MREVPLTVAINWPTPNYENPHTRGGALLGINIFLIILVTFAVVARIWARLSIKKWFGLDDAMIVLAYLFTIGMTAVVLLANRSYGWNRHIWDVAPGMIQNANIIAFVAKLMFTMASTFTRLSLLCFYYRLVKDSGIRWYKWALHSSLSFVLAICIAFIFMTVFTCIPVQVYWLFPQTVHGHCLNEGDVTMAAGILNCVADLLCTILPIPIVWRLQMPVRQRISVCILLCLGFVVTIAGIVRTYFIWKSLIDTWDETWFTYPLWIAAAVEIDIAVLCACAPVLKAILWKPLKNLTGKLSDRLSNQPKTTTGKGSVSSERPFYSEAGEKRTATEEIALVDLNSAERGTMTANGMFKSDAGKKDKKKPGSKSHSRSDSSSMLRSWPRSPSATRSLSLCGSPRPQTSPAPPQRLEILQETSFSVSAGAWPTAETEAERRGREKELPEVPEAERDERPRHRPLIPTKWRSDGRRIGSSEV